MNSFCIIGLGKFGQTIAETLVAQGKQIMVIDIDADKVNSIADIVDDAVIADATNEAALKAACVADYECVMICSTENLNDNILITLNCKELGVKKVVARAANEGHKKVLTKIGADVIIFPEKDAGERLAFTLSHEKISEFMEFKGYQIVETSVPKEWIGLNLLELDIRKKFGITIVAITDNNGAVSVSPSPSRVFAGNEKVAIVGDDDGIKSCIKKYNL